MLPANWQGDRCGHNYPIKKCPYEGCQARENLAELTALREQIARLATPPSKSDLEWTGKLILYGPNTIPAMNENTERVAIAITQARRQGAEAMREAALQWVDAIHEGKDGSRDPAVVDNVCSRIKHA